MNTTTEAGPDNITGMQGFAAVQVTLAGVFLLLGAVIVSRILNKQAIMVDLPPGQKPIPPTFERRAALVISKVMCVRVPLWIVEVRCLYLSNNYSLTSLGIFTVTVFSSLGHVLRPFLVFILSSQFRTALPRCHRKLRKRFTPKQEQLFVTNLTVNLYTPDLSLPWHLRAEKTSNGNGRRASVRFSVISEVLNMKT